jgi:hypothetical protein
MLQKKVIKKSRQLIVKICLLWVALIIQITSFSKDTTLQNLSHLTLKKGTQYAGIGLLPQSFGINYIGDKTFYTFNNSASLNVESFIVNRFSIIGYISLNQFYSSYYFDSSASLTERGRFSSLNPLLGIGAAYYPKFFQISPKRSSIHYNIGVFSVFNRSYVKGGFVNSTNKRDISDASINAGLIVQFYPKNRYHLPTERFSGQIIFNLPTYYIDKLKKGYLPLHSPPKIRYEHSSFFTLGIKYQLSPLPKQVNKEIPEKFRTSVFDQLYKEKSLHTSFGFDWRPVLYENNTLSKSINYMLINTDMEYFIKRRFSANLGYLRLRPSNPSALFDIQSSDRLSAFFTVYPKLMRGLNRFSFSASLGLSYFTSKVELLSEPNDLEGNFHFKTMQVFGAYSVNYKPMRILGRENHNFSLQFRTLGSLYTFQNLTKFREGDEAFKINGSGFSRGLLIRAVYKLK